MSENKPVGSTRTGKDVREYSVDQASLFFLTPTSKKADLLGDDVPSASEHAVSVPGGQKTNEDLLAEIFGGSNTMSPPAPTSASQPQRTTANDILSLFDSPPPSASTQATSPATASLFSLTSNVAPAPAAAAPPPKPAAPKLQSYTAYNKNDLMVSLTPQRSATQKGVVDILAGFQVTGSSPVTGINFQVAVPKVSMRGAHSEIFFYIDGYFATPPRQTQQLQMQPMSHPDVDPGATETQQMRVTAPVGVSLLHPTTISMCVLIQSSFFWTRRVTSDYVYEYRTRSVGGPSKTK